MRASSFALSYGTTTSGSAARTPSSFCNCAYAWVTVDFASGPSKIERWIHAKMRSSLSAVERLTIVCKRSASEPTTVKPRIPIAIPATVKVVRSGRDASSRHARITAMPYATARAMSVRNASGASREKRGFISLIAA